MDTSQSRSVVDKRGYEENVEEDDDNIRGQMPDSKKPKLTSLASVIVEALKVDSLQRLCSSLEPMLRRIVSEEVERALTKMGNGKFIGSMPAPPKLQGPQGRNLQLHFRTRMPPHLFTGGKVEGEQGAAIHIVLLDASTGCVVQTGQESGAKLNVVVLDGDFSEEVEEDWTEDHFENHEVKEREGKRPLLTGDLQVALKEGVGTLGDLTFTDNSSWIRSRKFRLGVKIAPGFCEGIRVREGKTEAFAVKDHRGELYKKHYPPALHDEVWRLDRIAKDGALHKKLVKAQIVTVEDFLRLLHQDPQKLRSILGSGMSNRMWENTVEHAKTCVLGGKLYVYYADGMHSTGVVFNHIYELRGLIDDGQFLAVESLNHNQKISVDMLVKQAYENWQRVIEYDGKVLNSISGTKNGKSASRLPIAVKSYNKTNYMASTEITQQYIPAEPSLQPQAVNSNSLVPQLIEFPFVRSEKNAVITPNNPQAPSISNVDFMQVGTPVLAETYFTGDWSRTRSGQGHGLEDFIAEEIRLRSSELLEADDMQRLLRTFNIGGFGQSTDACYSYNSQAYDPQMNQAFGQDQGRIGSGKAVVGWLKLKAALRWGIFIRKKAAERRAQLVELD